MQAKEKVFLFSCAILIPSTPRGELKDVKMTQDIKEFVEEYRSLARVKDPERKWAEGALFLRISEASEALEKADRKRSLIQEFLEATGMGANTFYNRRWVYRSYAPQERNAFLVPWAFFRLAAGRPDRLELLRRAQGERWTTRDLNNVIKGISPGSKVRVCSACRGPLPRNSMTVENVPDQGVLRFCNPGCLQSYFSKEY